MRRSLILAVAFLSPTALGFVLQRRVTVPKIVFLTAPNGAAPHHDHVQQLARANPGFDFRVFDDVEMDAAVKEASQHIMDAQLVKEDAGEPWTPYIVYKNLCPGAYKADFWRYMMLWDQGGIYMDMNLLLNRSLEDIVDLRSDRLQLARDIPGERREGYWNAFMAAPRRHPLLIEVVRGVMESVWWRRYGENDLDITGPRALYRILDFPAEERSKDDMEIRWHLEKEEKLNPLPCGGFSKLHCNVTLLMGNTTVASKISDGLTGSNHYSWSWKNNHVFASWRWADMSLPLANRTKGCYPLNNTF